MRINWSGRGKKCLIGNQSTRAVIFPISITRSNLHNFWLFLKIWIQLIQSYNYVFQSMLSSQCAYVDPGGRRITTRWAVNQRIEYSQPRLLDQIFIFLNYFERFEFNWFRATIMSFKVCRVVNAHMLIRAGEGLLLGGRSISAVISPTSITRSNLHIFWLFLKIWIQLIQSYNYTFQVLICNAERCYVTRSQPEISLKPEISPQSCWELI